MCIRDSDWRMGLAGLATIPLGVLFYAAMMRDYKPVSYTHLDVYKRQPPA